MVELVSGRLYLKSRGSFRQRISEMFAKFVCRVCVSHVCITISIMWAQLEGLNSDECCFGWVGLGCVYRIVCKSGTNEKKECFFWGVCEMWRYSGAAHNTGPNAHDAKTTMELAALTKSTRFAQIATASQTN